MVKPCTKRMHNKLLLRKHTLIVLLHFGVLTGLYGIMNLLFSLEPHIKPIAIENLHLGELPQESLPSSDGYKSDISDISAHSVEPDPCLRDRCLFNEFTVWEDWRACKSLQLKGRVWETSKSGGVVGLTRLERVRNTSDADNNKHEARGVTYNSFDGYIIRHSKDLPWQRTNYSAVLLEFRPLHERLAFSIQNAMYNLPVHWRIQVVGGPSICNATRQLFPVEVAAGKIVLTDIGERTMKHQSEVSAVLTDPDFYRKLLGDTWLFFQYDSVICAKQRHLLKGFIEKKRGWWGAPWSHWTREPRIGGNGGFSLRTKEFIFTILNRAPWTSDGRPEDWYFCNIAADLYEELPDHLRPATFEEEEAFSSETFYSNAPFGVHQYWENLSPESSQLRNMFTNCPEMLSIMPKDLVTEQPEWGKLVDDLNHITTGTPFGSNRDDRSL